MHGAFGSPGQNTGTSGSPQQNTPPKAIEDAPAVSPKTAATVIYQDAAMPASVADGLDEILKRARIVKGGKVSTSKATKAKKVVAPASPDSLVEDFGY